MSAAQIAAILGLGFSLAFDLVPGLKDKWESLSDETKRAGWFLGCLLVPGGLWMLACFGGVDPFSLGWECGTDGFVAMVQLAFAAYGLYQGSHSAIKLVKSKFGK